MPFHKLNNFVKGYIYILFLLKFYESYTYFRQFKKLLKSKKELPNISNSSRSPQRGYSTGTLHDSAAPLID